MKVLVRAGIGVLLALMLAEAQPAAQTPQATPPAAPASPQAPAARPAEPEQPPPEQERRRRRPSNRTSKRAPAQPMKGSITANRIARDAGPILQTLTFQSNLVGGYDDNLIGGTGASTGGGATPASMPSGSVGTLDAILAYSKGNNLHAFRMDTAGTAFAYPEYLDGPALGARAAIGGKTTLGRATTLDLTQQVGYDPLFSALAPDSGGASLTTGLDQVLPGAGLFERRSISSRSAASLERAWGRRDSTSVSYAYALRQFSDDEPGDNTSHSATAGYKHVVADGARLRADYRYVDLESTAAGDAIRPTTTHRVEGGVDLEHEVSPRRLVTWSLLAGASRIESIGATDNQPFTAWLPTGSGTLRLALSPTWFVEGRYRRDFSLLQGITNEVFATDTASLSTSGSLSQRTAIELGATYGNWRTPAAAGATTTFDVYGAQLQLIQMLNDTFGLTATYAYYQHHYSDPLVLPEGFPAAYDRNSVRVGITVRLPLIGEPTLRPGASR